MADDDLYGFTEEDVSKLRRYLEIIDSTPTNVLRDSTLPDVHQAPNHYAGRVRDATETLSAMTGTTPGKLGCWIYKIVENSGTPALQRLEMSTGTPLVLPVYNFHGVPVWYESGYFSVTQLKSGYFTIDNPRTRYKAKTTSTITDGGSGTVNVWFNGAVSSPLRTLTAYLNWMNGASTIDSGKEVVVEWYFDELKWTIDEREC